MKRAALWRADENLLDRRGWGCCPVCGREGHPLVGRLGLVTHHGSPLCRGTGNRPSRSDINRQRHLYNRAVMRRREPA